MLDRLQCVKRVQGGENGQPIRPHSDHIENPESAINGYHFRVNAITRSRPWQQTASDVTECTGGDWLSK